MQRLRSKISHRWRAMRLRLKPSGRATHGRRRLNRRIVLSLLVLIGLVVLALLVNNHLRPLITQMATVRVDYLASKAINQAVTTRIVQDNVNYDSLIHFEKDVYGQITALKTDMVTINRLKAEILDDVLAALSSLKTEELSIPLGNVIGGDLLSGRGPGIPIRVVPLGTVSAEFVNEFYEAGINQTRHQIMIQVQVSMSVLLPGYSCEKAVYAEVSIAETVIVGTVPDTYLKLQETGEIFRLE